jgi:ParB family chromosome partitioning protein
MALERDLASRLGLPVRVQPKAKGGTLSIEFRSLEQLDALIRRLT